MYTCRGSGISMLKVSEIFCWILSFVFGISKRFPKGFTFPIGLFSGDPSGALS